MNCFIYPIFINYDEDLIHDWLESPIVVDRKLGAKIGDSAMQEFQKNSQQKSETQQGLLIPDRYVGWIISSVMMLVFIIFMTGYFWGKKRALEAFCVSTERESLADHIYVALCGTPADDKEPSPNELDDEVVDEQESEVSSVVAENGTTPSNAMGQQSSTPAGSQASLQIAHNKEDEVNYHAELIGFGTMQGAKRFAARLEKKQMPVVINKRVSRTARGRVVNWYQVVTTDYKNKDELISFVNIVKQQERLNDVRIVTNTDRC